MSKDVEAMIREGAPRVTRQPEAFLATLSVSEEAAGSSRRGPRRPSAVAWAIGAASALVAVGGTGAAVAASQGIWWNAPHDVVAVATPVTDEIVPAMTVSCILEADFAPGVDGAREGGQGAFELAQQWLVGHPVVVAVPIEAQTLTGDEESTFVQQGWPAQIALNFKAIRASQDAVDEAAASGHQTLTAELGRYLTAQGADAALLVVADHGGYCEVGH